MLSDSSQVQPPDPTNAPPEYQYEKVPLNFSRYEVMGYVLGGIPIPTESQLSGAGIGGGFGGGYGGGFGGGGLGGGHTGPAFRRF